MQLTGKQIVKNNIVTGVCEAGIQQQGVDVCLMEVQEVIGGGYVPAEGKTRASVTRPVRTLDDKYYLLTPGYYELTFMEGCKIPNNATLKYKTRSSLVRCGAIVHSGQFDAGFETEHMGCFLQVLKPIKIEVGARIAQAIVNESYPVDAEDLYNGQWQNDNQREKQ